MIPDPPTPARRRRTRTGSLLALLPGFTLLLAGGACERTVPQRDLLLVTIDTLRVDHVSAYGHARSPATPAFDRIASEGLLFEQAVAPAPLTLPSHASLLTGQRPFRHGVRDNGGFRLQASIPTLAEVLKARGYRTAAFVGAFVLDSRFGLDRGFDVYGDDMGKALPQRGGYLGDVRRGGRAVADAAAAWIAGAGPEPIFVWAHLYDPHAPYEAEAVYRDRYPGRAYAAAVAQADAALGRVLEAFERRPGSPSAVVAIVGDHGESLGEHGELTHGVFLYDATLRVPLALRGPGLEPGMRIPWQVRLIDLAPTLLSLAGASPHSGNRSAPGLAADGIDLCPALRGEAPVPRLPAYAESLFGTYHYGWSPLRALREGGFKWIEAPRPELYDLGRDPGETENLWSHEPSRIAEMSERLALIAGSRIVSEPPPGPEDPETLARLRALGYVGGGMSDGREAPGSTAGPRAAHLPDPKDGIHRHARFEEGFREAAVRFDAGDYEPAHQRASRLLHEFPEARDARRLRALAAFNLGHEEEARRDFEQLLQQDPGDIEALIGMGRVLERQGQRPQALALYRRALASGPEQPALRLRAARLMRLDGNLDEADAQLRRALALDPSLAAAAFERGLVRLARGTPEEAESFFRQAARIDAGLRGVHHNLALLREQAGDPQGARREYEEELRHHPDSYASHLNLGLLLGRQAEHASALRHLEAAARTAPRQPRALTALAAALLRRRGGEARASALLEKALQIDPGYAPALNLLEKLTR